jgi:hypothetical protein
MDVASKLSSAFLSSSLGVPTTVERLRSIVLWNPPANVSRKECRGKSAAHQST